MNVEREMCEVVGELEMRDIRVDGRGVSNGEREVRPCLHILLVHVRCILHRRQRRMGGIRERLRTGGLLEVGAARDVCRRVVDRGE